MKASGGIFSVYEIIPGFIASSVAIIIVSLATKLPKELAHEFEEAKNLGYNKIICCLPIIWVYKSQQIN